MDRRRIMCAHTGANRLITPSEPITGLITFTIDGTEYQAEEGMTWGEWANSEYDVNGKFSIDIDNSIGYNSFTCWVGGEYDYVYASDIIQEGYNYWLVG